MWKIWRTAQLSFVCLPGCNLRVAAVVSLACSPRNTANSKCEERYSIQTSDMKKMEQESKESMVDCTQSRSKAMSSVRGLGSNERMLGQRGIHIISAPRSGWGLPRLIFGGGW